MSAPAATGVACPLCGWTADEFLRQGRLGRANARCGGCNSLERHRALYLFLRDETSLLKSRTRLLHIAPEEALRRVFESEAKVEYVTTDLEMKDVSLRMDICDLLFKDGTFDCVICSHVLEHVPDDLLAMRELRRVVKPGGIALIMVPIQPTPDGETFEDSTVESADERERLFGQRDHVRIYGEDFPDRLRESGFDVEEIRPGRSFDESRVVSHGLYPDERIFVSRPAQARTSAPPATSLRRLPFEDVAGVGFDTRIAENDPQAAPERPERYFEQGLAALRLIEGALEEAKVPEPEAVLDFQCGYGRVLRMLRTRFPGADITACDDDRAAAEFCRDTLGADFASTIEELSSDARFELIWCGSLMAHLTQDRARELLVDLSARLDPSGVLVFTAPGKTWLRRELSAMQELTVLATRRRAWEGREDVYICQGGPK